MHNPTVAAVMLVNGRPEMVNRAIRCFREQTYDPVKRMLLVFDTGEVPYRQTPSDSENEAYLLGSQYQGKTIGNLRNMANACANAEIIVHLDSDDWSHPRRIEEQVALLQASGKDCVGYRDMLFWDDRKSKALKLKTPAGGWTKESLESIGLTWPPQQGWLDRLNEAYLYTNPQPSYALGTSLCYWRRAWEQNQFADLPKHGTGGGEDTDFIRRVDTLGVTLIQDAEPGWTKAPRMIASLHGKNTSSITALAIKYGDPMIRRVPEWDAYARERMQL